MTRLLIICGWSVRPVFFDAFVARYFGELAVTVVEVDADAVNDLVVWQARTAENVDAETLVVGWSLGGMLAIRLAHYLERNGQPYLGLLTLMASPVFVQKSGWEGAMSESDFEMFRAGDQKDGASGRSFSRILSSGFESPRKTLKAVSSLYLASIQEQPIRAKTLELLESLNEAQALASLKQEAFMVFADNDPLLSEALRVQIQSFCPQHNYIVLDNHGHFPLTEDVADVLRNVLSERC